jgi:hypothetical protein
VAQNILGPIALQRRRRDWPSTSVPPLKGSSGTPQQSEKLPRAVRQHNMRAKELPRTNDLETGSRTYLTIAERSALTI